MTKANDVLAMVTKVITITVSSNVALDLKIYLVMRPPFTILCKGIFYFITRVSFQRSGKMEIGKRLAMLQNTE